MTPKRLSTRDILEVLIGFDSTSRNSNMPLIEWVRDYLGTYGIDSHLAPNPDGTKANLFATAGPQDTGGIALSGHTDVVPVDDQDWSTDPFTLHEGESPDGPALFGRGTCDMKGFIAAALARVPDLSDGELATPVHFALSFDEEIGCRGVPYLLKDIGDNLPRPALAIIGEPTGMEIANAHKGIAAFETIVTGVEAHSSRIEEAASAIVAATRLISFILTIANEHRQAPRDDAFSPPFTTFNIGTIQGGTAVNIVPRHCRLQWEFRPLPGVDPHEIKARIDRFVETELLPEMRTKYPGAAIETETLALAPGLSPDPGSPAERLVREITGANRSGTVSFATEAGLFQAHGVPAVVIGPGSIAQAHQPDEYVTLDQLEKAGHFLDQIVERARSGRS